MPRISKLLTDEIVSLAEAGLKRQGRTGVLANKLQAIISARKHGIKKVSTIYGISRTSLTSWINSIREGSLEGLKPKAKKPRSPITPTHQEIIKGWLGKDSHMTINSLRIKIEEELGIKIGKTAVHRHMQKLGFAYITARPRHHKQSQELQAGFKKKSSRSHQGQSQS